MDITQGSMNGLFRSFRIVYDDALQAAKPLWPTLAQDTPSGTMEQVFDWLDSIGSMEELIGEVNTERAKLLDFAIRNKEWQKTVKVREASILADQYGAYKPAFSALGDVAAYHPDELLSKLLVNGFADSALDYTGTPFFAVNKPLDSAGKYKITNKTTKKLSVDNFVAARTVIKSFKNSKGRAMGLGRKLQLVVSPKNESLGRQILIADYVQQTAQNVAKTENVGASAVTNVNKGTAELVVWPQLAVDNEDAWFLIETGFAIKPFAVQFLLKPRLVAVTNPGDSYVLLNHEFLYQAYGVYNAGYLFPQLCYGSDGSTAA